MPSRIVFDRPQQAILPLCAVSLAQNEKASRTEDRGPGQSGACHLIRAHLSMAMPAVPVPVARARYVRGKKYCKRSRKNESSQGSLTSPGHALNRKHGHRVVNPVTCVGATKEPKRRLHWASFMLH